MVWPTDFLHALARKEARVALFIYPRVYSVVGKQERSLAAPRSIG